MSTPFDHLQGMTANWVEASDERAPRVRRMLDTLPLILQNGSNIRELFTVIAGELGALDAGMTRLMRSKWYRLSIGYPDDTDTQENPLLMKADSELGRFAALFGIAPARGETTEYLRQHIDAMVEIHRLGLASAPAILRLVSLLYQGEQPPNIGWIKNANDEFVATWEFEVKTDPNSAPKSYRVELIDNPVLPAKAAFGSTPSGVKCVVTNRCLKGHLRQTLPDNIVLKAVDADIRVPVITLGKGIDRIVFVGTIPKGQALVLRSGEAPLLDGKAVDSTKVFKMHVKTVFDDENSRFDDSPGGVEFETLQRFDELGSASKIPTLPEGESIWSWDTLDRAQLKAFLAGWFNDKPVDAALLQAALETKNANQRADFELHWQEMTSATFELRIPKDYVPPHYDAPEGQADSPNWGMTALVRDIERVLACGRAAGVRSRIEIVPGT